MPTVALLALHGFGGTGADFEPVVQATSPSHLQWATPDLPAHGSFQISRSELPNLSFSLTDAFVTEAFSRLAADQRWLLGYSMGGRIALHAVCSGSVKPDRLILIGASPGLECPRERASRLDLEEAWATRVEREGMARFAEFWTTLPIIQSQEAIPEPTRSLIQRRRAEQNPANIAQVLRSLGTGRMPSLWPALARITCPTDLFTGARDGKFARIAQRMLPHLIKGRHMEISHAGHTAHLENPTEFAHHLMQ
ncbi:MAG: 2-succinyl-6-hydroxy-2,4-cyclohexadiene-1-carboxylate synthase [Opitutales bacterium]|nr:2-succinyl-6-hydroxy-2,4-cyclohexadiene-1-carboxylate synthase [Opitutales bacterium]